MKSELNSIIKMQYEKMLAEGDSHEVALGKCIFNHGMNTTAACFGFVGRIPKKVRPLVAVLGKVYPSCMEAGKWLAEQLKKQEG